MSNRPGPIRRAAGTTIGWLLLASLVAVLLVGLAPGVASATSVDEGVRSIDPIGLIPDLTLVAEGATSEQPDDLAARLEAIDGVSRAIVANPDNGTEGAPLTVNLALADSAGSRRPLDGVVARAIEVLEQETGPVTVTAGGSALVDRELADRFDGAAGWLAVLAAIIGFGLGLADGWRRGLVAGVGLGAAVLAAGSIGGQVAGPFAGSMAETGLPATLGALVVGVALVTRLIVWSRRPEATDGAAAIQQAVGDLGVELILLAAGLIATSLIVEAVDPGRSAVTVVSTGALTAVVVIIAIVTPALVMLGPAPDGPRTSWLPFTVADGRHLPALVVGLAALALAIVSVAAVGHVSDDLLDVGDLDQSSPEAQVAAALARQGGDPTQALVVTAEGARPGDLAGWTALASERPEVAWIDLGQQRYTSTGVVDLAPSEDLSDPAAPGAAVVVPAASPRSVEGRDLVDRLAAVPLAGDGPRFIGPSAVAADLTGSRTTVLVAIGLLALAAGIGALVLTGNRALFLTSFVLRLLGGGATVGLHNLIAPDPTLASVLTALTVVGVGAWLAELELLRRLESEVEVVSVVGHCPVPGPPGSNPGQFGVLGLAALVPAGLLLVVLSAFGGGPGMVRIGLVLALAAMAEVLVGAAVLRPALLGQRAAFQTAVRPLRVAVHGRSTGDPEAETPPDDDPAWSEVVADLIETEFWLQAQPERARLDAVFEADTPVHRQAAERHANLVRSGLRVVGRNPELRSLRTVRERQPVILTVTVDHPTSQLLDQNGHVVGVRRPERRVGRLWLSASADGCHRIAESVELGVTPLDGDDEPVPPV